MNCRRAKSDIALWAGNDLDEPSLFGLRNHLQACPACRSYLEEMQALMRLVDECPLRDQGDEISKSAVEASLWPSLSARLVSLPSPRHDHFNGWLPAVAVAAVCLAMVIVASPPQLQTPQDASALSVAAEESWAVDPASKPLADPVSPRRMQPLPIPGIPVDVREELPTVLGNDLRAMRQRKSYPPTLMQSSTGTPWLQEENDPFSFYRRQQMRSPKYFYFIAE